MQIQNNTVVSLDYILRLDSEFGEIVEATEPGSPLVFLFGAGNMIPDFEKNLENLTTGDAFSFGIVAERAYGTVEADAFVDIPRAVFEANGGKAEEIVSLGQYITLTDQNGNPHQGKVHEFKETTVTMDFNHPMAGKNLFFTGAILEVRKATLEEIAHGHVHGPGGHHH